MYGSEIKSFLKHPNFKKELNKEALKPYMTFQYSALDETFFKNVFRIKEGHYFTYKDGVLDIKPYWDMKVDEKDMSLEESIDLMQVLVEDKCILLIALQQPIATDLRILSTALKIATDLERIGDYAENIARIAWKKTSDKQLGEKYRSFENMSLEVTDMLNKVLQAYQNQIQQFL